MRAKFLYETTNQDGIVEWWYEYSIEPYSTNWPLSELHKNEQLNIDRQIEIDEKQSHSTFKSESAEKGFELFWKYLEE